MYFGEHLSFSGTLDCLRADIVDSDTAKERRSKRAQRYDSQAQKIHFTLKIFKFYFPLCEVRNNAALKKIMNWHTAGKLDNHGVGISLSEMLPK